MNFKNILKVILILLFIFLAFVGYKINKEYKYKSLIKDMFKEVAVTYSEISQISKNKDTSKMISDCPQFIAKHNEWLNKINSIDVPKKYQSSHPYFKESIIDLNTGIKSVCDGSNKNSVNMVLEGFKTIQKAQEKMLKGKDILLEEQG